MSLLLHISIWIIFLIVHYVTNTSEHTLTFEIITFIVIVGIEALFLGGGIIDFVAWYRYIVQCIIDLVLIWSFENFFINAFLQLICVPGFKYIQQ